MAAASYIGQALPAKIVRVSATNLFRVAALELGDALQWTRIASLNGLTDPWIMTATTLAIPSPSKAASTGIPNG